MLVIFNHAGRNPGGGRVWPAAPRCAHGGNRQSGTIPDHFRIRTGKIERVDDVRYVLRPCSSCSTSDALMSSLFQSRIRTRRTRRGLHYEPILEQHRHQPHPRARHGPICGDGRCGRAGMGSDKTEVWDVKWQRGLGILPRPIKKH